MKLTPGSARAGSWLTILLVLALVLTGLYAAMAALSFRFTPDIPGTARPVLATLALLGFAFAVYLAAVFVALRARDGYPLLAVVVLASVLFRVVSVYSWPVLEIDIYRYIWDGAVMMEGVSPYRYSPQQVLSATPQAEIPDDLDRLVRLRDGKTAVETVLSRVHYGELPTIYPPVSQAVFAVATYFTPSSTGVSERVVAMKVVFVLFDLATLAVVVALLRLTGKHVGWSVAYGWCPLVIKEIANTGHLDSLAVFLTILALFLLVKPLANGGDRGVSCGRGTPGRKYAPASAVVLALAVGAKLYPVVLAPLFAAVWARSFGWRWASAAVLAFVITTAAVLWPMVPSKEPPSPSNAGAAAAGRDDSLPPPPVDTATIAQNPTGGLTAFLRRWEMNDFLFMLVVENLKPSADVKPEQRPWFSIVPDTWRGELVAIPSRWFQLDPSRAPFLIARFLTAVAFLVILAVLVWRARPSEDPAVWLGVAFLVLAWFWLLSPTQNPWYWIWALPLVMFARSKAWLAVSGLAMVYYLRFWLAYHWPGQPVLGTPYSGATFFDLAVTWIEYGPWFVWLAWDTARRRTAPADMSATVNSAQHSEMEGLLS
ncbi:MAG: DUF2029 domain-containing protein [Planctomycetes bacterium]|nr:DUF2029 domain-containing protein [Planctomycetota bacterium]